MATAAEVLTATWEELDGSRFMIQPLSGADMLRVSDVVTFDEKGRTLFNAAACITAIRYGLKGWDQFKDKENEDVVFVANMEKNIERIPFDLVRPLALLILGKSQVEAEDVKN